MPDHARHPVAAVLQALGSLLPRRRCPTAGAVVRPWRDDALRSYPARGLTPPRLFSFLQSADAGQPQLMFELFEDMLTRWPRLAAVAATRRLALTGLEWELVPAESPDTALAVATADHCRAVLQQLDRFRPALDHLASALGHGLAVAELVWEDGRLVDLVPVPHSRLIADPHEPWRLCVRTEQEPALGVPLDAQPHKWLVHQPRPRPGRPFDGGLLRASALLFLAQSLSLRDWLSYTQIAGTPMRIAQYEPGLSDHDKQRLLRMLVSLGSESVAAFGKNIDVRLLEATHVGDKPYRPLLDYCNTEVTILWLGQHLTTDIRERGSRAAAEVHDRVREDLLVDDIADEGATLRRDLLTPLVRARFGDGAPVPHFRRALVQSVDTKALVATLSVAVNELGVAVPRRWLYDALGIPTPTGDEPVITAEGRA